MSKFYLLTLRACLATVLCSLGIFTSLSEARDYWLIYSRDKNGNIQYREHAWFDDSDTDDLLAKKTKILEKYEIEFQTDNTSGKEIPVGIKKRSPSTTHPDLASGKPIITKKDDAHTLLMFFGGGTFLCVKTYEPFTPPAPAPQTPSVPAVGPPPDGFTCDLDSQGKGNTKITYSISELPAAAGEPPKEKLREEVRVRELYRFRITAGPVWSSLISRNKSYKTVPTAGQDFVITSSSNNQAPVNFPIFLKMYWEEHDILAKGPAFTDIQNSCDLINYLKYRINPIVGINLVDDPLKNYYMGLSFEVFSGLDIVGGAHFGKITQLAGGFQNGQSVPSNTQPPTVDKFLTGGFFGVTADLGVIGSWIGNSIVQMIKTNTS